MNVSEQLLKFLQLENVKYVFGVAGDALNPLVDAIRKQDKVTWVPVNHEGNGAYAAYAQGELGSTIGVCASTVGPGALHLVNGLYNAKKERTPVLVITGQVPVHQLGTDYHQEVNLAKVFEDICEYQALIRTPEEAPKKIARAINIAMHNNAVCRIELPSDIALMKATNSNYVKSSIERNSIIQTSDSKIKRVAEILNKSSSVGILAGVGCRNAKNVVLKLSQKLQAPITHSLKASDIFDHSTENVVGLTGLIGNPSGYKGVMECDTLLLLGTDFPYSDFLPESTFTIQIDNRIENIGIRTPVDLGVHADIKSTITSLIEIIDDKPTSNWLNGLVKDFKDWKNEMAKKSSLENTISPPHPMSYASEISRIASDDTIFVIDTGTSAIWASNYMNFHSDRRIIGSFNHGSMAVGLPAAIGAQLLYPDREVWALMGDGAFNMCMQDFKTAVKLNLPIKILVFNNKELGFVKIEMEEAGLAPNFDALKVDNIDIGAYANLCGGYGINVDETAEIKKAIKSAQLSEVPCIINAHCNPGELSLPPKIELHHVQHFGASKIKEIVASLKGDARQWENIKNEVNAFFN